MTQTLRCAKCERKQQAEGLTGCNVMGLKEEGGGDKTRLGGNRETCRLSCVDVLTDASTHPLLKCTAVNCERTVLYSLI